ncbi:MAG: hypothetical protein JWP36_2287 [Paucimonas sp.]|nr:hypothetical protein [Paucimonas sp.]
MSTPHAPAPQKKTTAGRTIPRTPQPLPLNVPNANAPAANGPAANGPIATAPVTRGPTAVTRPAPAPIAGFSKTHTVVTRTIAYSSGLHLKPRKPNVQADAQPKRPRARTADTGAPSTLRLAPPLPTPLPTAAKPIPFPEFENEPASPRRADDEPASPRRADDEPVSSRRADDEPVSSLRTEDDPVQVIAEIAEAAAPVTPPRPRSKAAPVSPQPDSFPEFANEPARRLSESAPGIARPAPEIAPLSGSTGADGQATARVDRHGQQQPRQQRRPQQRLSVRYADDVMSSLADPDAGARSQAAAPPSARKLAKQKAEPVGQPQAPTSEPEHVPATPVATAKAKKKLRPLSASMDFVWKTFNPPRSPGASTGATSSSHAKPDKRQAESETAELHRLFVENRRRMATLLGPFSQRLEIALRLGKDKSMEELIEGLRGDIGRQSPANNLITAANSAVLNEYPKELQDFIRQLAAKAIKLRKAQDSAPDRREKY